MKKPARCPRPRTRFVPGVVYRTAFASVIPLCVAGVACGGSVSAANGPGSDSGGDSGDDGASPVVITGGVGCAGFMCASVGAIAFDAGEDTTTFFVAAIAFDSGAPQLDGAADRGPSPDADAASQDAPADATEEIPVFAVACAGFCGGGDAGSGGAG
jgi:hypothetical protein